MMTKMSTTLWDSAEYLKTEGDRQLYMQACLEEAGDDPIFMMHALRVVARAKNMNQLAREMGLTREGLHKVLLPESNPTFVTVIKLANALGFTLSLHNNMSNACA